MKITIQNQTICINLTKNITVDELLQSFHISKKTKYSLYQEQQLLYQNQNIKNSILLKKGETIYIKMKNIVSKIAVSKIPITIVYEDELFLIVNKPINCIVHEDGNSTDTLANRVQYYFDQQQITAPVRAIHRLDKDTTGLVIFCKLPFFQPLLDYQLQHKHIQRFYYAIITGELSQNVITIDKAIANDRHHATKQRISKTGKSAVTHIKKIKSFSDYSLVECSLETGRKHQIRVHLQSMMHPIIGDLLYGTSSKHINRLALHAYKLTFIHPFTQKQMNISCDLPKDMNILVSA